MHPDLVPERILDGPFFEQVSRGSKELEHVLDSQVASGSGRMLALNSKERPSAEQVLLDFISEDWPYCLACRY